MNDAGIIVVMQVKLVAGVYPPDLAEAVGNTSVGQVVGPIATDKEQKYHLLMVKEFIPAELTPERCQDIIDRLFKDWLKSEFNSLVHNKFSLTMQLKLFLHYISDQALPVTLRGLAKPGTS